MHKFGLLLIIALLLVACGSQPAVEPTPPPAATQPPAATTPAPTATPRPAPTAEPAPSAAALEGRYADPLGGYQVQYPAAWTVQTQGADQVLLGPDSPDPDQFLLVVARSLSFVEAEAEVAPIETAEQLAAVLAPALELDPQALEATAVAGQPALWGPWSDIHAGREMAGRVLFFTGQGQGYVLTVAGRADQAAAFEATAQAMLDSFALVPPAVTAEYADAAGGYFLLYPEGWAAEADDTGTKITPLAGLEPDDGPYVALIRGAENLASTFQVDGELTAASLIAAFVAVTGAQVGDQQTVSAGGEEATAVQVGFKVDDVAVVGLFIAWEPAARPLAILGLSPASQWESFTPTFVTMMDSLSLEAAAAGVDFSDPAGVVQAVLDAARTQDFSLLAGLCDPLGENDGDTAAICAITAEHPDRASFVAYFQGTSAGEAVISGDRAEVPVLLGPGADQAETMVLIQRDGKWYLLEF